jgi:hypothetical protein
MLLRTIFIPALAAMLALAACATIPGGVAPSTTPIEGRKYSILSKATGTSNRVALLGILPLTSPNTLRDAIDEAITSAGGDALIDVTVDCYSQYWILFSRTVTQVSGTAIRFDQ